MQLRTRFRHTLMWTPEGMRESVGLFYVVPFQKNIVDLYNELFCHTMFKNINERVAHFSLWFLINDIERNYGIANFDSVVQLWSTYIIINSKAHSCCLHPLWNMTKAIHQSRHDNEVDFEMTCTSVGCRGCEVCRLRSRWLDGCAILCPISLFSISKKSTLERKNGKHRNVGKNQEEEDDDDNAQKSFTNSFRYLFGTCFWTKQLLV